MPSVFCLPCAAAVILALPHPCRCRRRACLPHRAAPHGGLTAITNTYPTTATHSDNSTSPPQTAGYGMERNAATVLPVLYVSPRVPSAVPPVRFCRYTCGRSGSVRSPFWFYLLPVNREDVSAHRHCTQLRAFTAPAADHYYHPNASGYTVRSYRTLLFAAVLAGRCSAAVVYYLELITTADYEQLLLLGIFAACVVRWFTGLTVTIYARGFLTAWLPLPLFPCHSVGFADHLRGCCFRRACLLGHYHLTGRCDCSCYLHAALTFTAPYRSTAASTMPYLELHGSMHTLLRVLTHAFAFTCRFLTTAFCLLPTTRSTIPYSPCRSCHAALPPATATTTIYTAVRFIRRGNARWVLFRCLFYQQLPPPLLIPHCYWCHPVDGSIRFLPTLKIKPRILAYYLPCGWIHSTNTMPLQRFCYYIPLHTHTALPHPPRLPPSCCCHTI